MVISRLPAFRPIKCHRQIVVVVALCAVFLAVGTKACGTYSSSIVIPEYEAAGNPARQQRIKRLMPVDPESTEVMLADRGLDFPSHA